MIDGCLTFILIKSWIWIFWWFVGTIKYMAMAVVSIFVGPGKTIHRLAASNTVRKAGYLDPELYKVERAKVVLWMIWAYLFWAGLLVMGIYMGAVRGVS